jgi:predicted Zn-dependent protease
MSLSRIDGLRAQCDGPRDGALLRFSLGSALLEEGQWQAARAELERAIAFDPRYSAAWKLLGKARAAAGEDMLAAQAWREGIRVASARGDQQAAKEMTVFLRRIERNNDPVDGSA